LAGKHSLGTVAGRYLIAADGAKGPMANGGFKERKRRLGGALEAGGKHIIL